MIIPVNNFCKTLHHRCLTEFWICLWFWLSLWFCIYQGLEYARVLTVGGFWICQGSKYMKILNMPGFWICQGSKYIKILNMPGLHMVLKMPEYASIPEHAWLCQNMSECAKICVNIFKSAWMAFVLYFLSVIPYLCERMVTHFT